MKILIQPEHNQCGQTCVAMITSSSVRHVCEVMKCRARTTPRDLRRGLGKLGFNMERRASYVLPNYPSDFTALMLCKTVQNHVRVNHWCVWHGGQIYDPIDGVSSGLDKSWYARFYLVNAKT